MITELYHVTEQQWLSDKRLNFITAALWLTDIFFSPGATTPIGGCILQPLAGFSLLACEVS